MFLSLDLYQTEIITLSNINIVVSATLLIINFVPLLHANLIVSVILVAHSTDPIF